MLCDDHGVLKSQIIIGTSDAKVRHDMGMGNTVTIWSQIGLGKGRGWGQSYLSNTTPILMVLWLLMHYYYLMYTLLSLNTLVL